VTDDPWKPPVDAPPDASLDLYRTIALSGFGLAVLLDGVVESGYVPLVVRVFAALTMAAAATMWCIVDASSRGDYYPHSFRWLTMIVWPVAVPVYLVRTRKRRGILLAVAGLVAVLLLAAAGAALGNVLGRPR
jgi:hypothetical protein